LRCVFTAIGRAGREIHSLQCTIAKDGHAPARLL
jgi:hypothetical protein